jgi:hypothetical protein
VAGIIIIAAFAMMVLHIRDPLPAIFNYQAQ